MANYTPDKLKVLKNGDNYIYDFAAKMNTSLKGAANGVAELDSTGKVPSSQLPSYVDDVVDGYYYNGRFYEESTHTTEITGESGKIYVDLDTNKTYRWSGTTFVVIASDLALGETSSTAYRGDRGADAYAAAVTNVETTPTSGSSNLITSGGVYTALGDKADKTDTVLLTTLSMGRKANTTVGTNSVALGYSVTASATVSHAEGYNTTASGNYAHAEGCNSLASGMHSHAEGSGTSAYGYGSHAEGTKDSGATIVYDNVTYNCGATGIDSHSEGYNTAAYGDYSHAEGQGTLAKGQSSHAEGAASRAIGVLSHAEGVSTQATGPQSHAEGASSVASGAQSHAEGSSTTASGAQSHAEGSGTTASGSYSHAEGSGTTASEMYSHAEGYGTIASNQSAHAEGQATKATGKNSHAEGFSTIANHWAQHVYGDYNIADPSSNLATSRGNYVEIVGNGTADNARSNARTLDWNGNERLKGDLYVNCNADSAGGTKVTPLPSAPVSDGTYILQCTVSSGTATYSWVSLPAASGVSF